VRIRQQPAGDVLPDDVLQGRVTCDVIKADWSWTATSITYSDSMFVTLHCGDMEKLEELGVELRMFESEEKLGVRMHQLSFENFDCMGNDNTTPPGVFYLFRPRSTSCWMALALARVSEPEL
jgi:hypothetical protein